MDPVTQPTPPSSVIIEADLREEKVLFTWNAPDRAFKRRDRDFWVTAIAILILVSIILLFIQESFLIIALISVLFLYYVLSTIPPGQVIDKVTNRGIYFGDLFYPWSDLARFWFGKTLDQQAVFFETKLHFPRQVCLVIESSNQDELQKIIVKYLPLVQNSPRFIDKTSTWIMSKLPLEDRPVKSTSK